MKTILALLALLLLSSLASSQSINLITSNSTIPIAQNGVRSAEFYQQRKEMDCGMPELYIFPDYNHTGYTIEAETVVIQSVEALWAPITYSLTINASMNTSLLNINNDCGETGTQLNWIKIGTSIGQIEYLVNCDPSTFYKPFEWGLLLLIIFTTLILTLGSLFSKAWSYGGIGYEITNRAILIFNLAILLFIVLGFLFHEAVSLVAQIVGTIIGAGGVGLCISEAIWLTHNKNYQKKVYKKIRVIDVISYGIGGLFIPLYWILNGQWIVNDIMAICATVALMKLLKVKSLSIAVNLLGSLLVLEILVGVVVHYVLKISYNNYIINLFQNPVMLVMPSITKELYRQCAWLPITAALFPGLVLSYLRRFDKSRGTYLYFLIGLGSFYFGSICWMLVDLETVHSLPFAIISEPITIVIVAIQSFRRNEFKTLWRGSFHDEELNESDVYILNKETEIIHTPTIYADLTDNLRISADSSSNYEAIKLSEEYKL